MNPPSAAASPAITVLIADSNRMQAQLLTSALRRRSEFRISTCQVDIASILQAVALGAIVEAGCAPRGTCLCPLPPPYPYAFASVVHFVTYKVQDPTQSNDNLQLNVQFMNGCSAKDGLLATVGQASSRKTKSVSDDGSSLCSARKATFLVFLTTATRAGIVSTGRHASLI